jgi:uncharacterized protein (DUF2249 family)
MPILDVSALEPPGPLERILDALTDLPQGQSLCVRHRREPFPLYDLLRRMGYQWRTRGGEDRFEIMIWAATADADPTPGPAPAWPC